MRTRTKRTQLKSWRQAVQILTNCEARRGRKQIIVSVFDFDNDGVAVIEGEGNAPLP